jgi:hypothetical protein
VTELRHREGCDPEKRTPTSCPCGVLDAYIEAGRAMADDLACRQQWTGY